MQAQVSGPTPEIPSTPPLSDTSKTQQQTQSASAAGASIASMIYHMVLIEFLGSWNSKLAAAATNANFLSGSVSFYNEIIKDLADFNLADSNLNFTSQFPEASSPSGEYVGTAADATKARDDEVAWAQKQKDQIATEEGKIADKKNEINADQAKLDQELKDGTITQSDYDAQTAQNNKLLGQLNDLDTSLNKASTDLTTLINDLNALGTFTDDPDNPGQFRAEGGSWDTVEADEKAASNDLTGIYNTITNNQSDWTTASTNAQMAMQLLISTSGQIMSAVSTIMSLWSQASSVPATGVKGQ